MKMFFLAKMGQIDVESAKCLWQCREVHRNPSRIVYFYRHEDIMHSMFISRRDISYLEDSD